MVTINKMNEVLQTVKAILAFDDIYVPPKKISKKVRGFAESMMDDPDMLYRVIHQNLYMVKELQDLKNTLQKMIDEPQTSIPGPLDIAKIDDGLPSNVPVYWSFMKEMNKLCNKARAAEELKRKTNEAPGFTFLDGTELIDQTLRKHIMKRIKAQEEPKPPLNSGAPDDVRIAIDNLSVVDGCCVVTRYSLHSGFEAVPLSLFADKQLVAFKEEIGRRMFQPGFFIDVAKAKVYAQAISEITKLLAERQHVDHTVSTTHIYRPTHTVIRGYPTYAVSPSEPGRIIKVQGFFRTPYSVYEPEEKMVVQVYRHLYRMVAGTCSTISDPVYDDLYELYVRFVLKTEMNRRDTKSNSGLIRVGMFPTGPVLYPTSISPGIKSTDIGQNRWGTLVKIFGELKNA